MRILRTATALCLLSSFALAERPDEEKLSSKKVSTKRHLATQESLKVDPATRGAVLLQEASMGVDSIKDSFSQLARSIGNRCSSLAQYLRNPAGTAPAGTSPAGTSPANTATPAATSAVTPATDSTAGSSDKKPGDNATGEDNAWATTKVAIGVQASLKKLGSVVNHPRTQAMELPEMKEVVKQIHLTTDGTGFCAKAGEFKDLGCAAGHDDGDAICKCGGMFGVDILVSIGLSQPCYQPPIPEEYNILKKYETTPKEAVEEAKALFFGRCQMTLWQSVLVFTAIVAGAILLCGVACCCCCGGGKKKRNRDQDF